MESKNRLSIVIFIVEMIIVTVISIVFTYIGKGDFIISYLFFLSIFSILSIIGVVIGTGIFKLKIDKLKQFVVFNRVVLVVVACAALFLIVYPMVSNPR